MPAQLGTATPVRQHDPDDAGACIGLMLREQRFMDRMYQLLARLDDEDSDSDCFDRHLAGDQLVGLAITLRDLLKQHPRFES